MRAVAGGEASIGSTEAQVNNQEVSTRTVTSQNGYFESYTNVALDVTWPIPVTHVSQVNVRACVDAQLQVGLDSFGVGTRIPMIRTMQIIGA